MTPTATTFAARELQTQPASAELETATATPATWPGRLARGTLAVVLSFLMACVSFWLFTRNNDFPIDYHPDEITKVGQLMSERQMRNFNHPLLLLETAHLAIRTFNIDQDDSFAVVRAGRATSAGIAAVGMCGLALAAYVGYGFVGLGIAGAAAMLCPPVLVYAHYLKEDASLVGGIALSILGVRLVLGARSAWPQLLAAIAMGVGCAVAASGKAVGAAVLIPATLTILVAPVPRWWAVPLRIILFVVATVACAVAINARAFDDPWNLTVSTAAYESLKDELEHGIGDHYGLSMAQPNRFCLDVALSEVQLHVWALAAVGSGCLIWLTFRVRWVFTRWGMILALYLMTFIAALSYNVIPFGRYALPISMLIYYCGASLAAAGIVSIAATTRWPRRVTAGAGIACALIVICFQGARCLNFNRQFADDSRQRLREWMATNIPPYSALTVDHYSLLDKGGDPHRFPNQTPLRQNVPGYGFASSMGSLETQAARGIRYVITAQPDYSRFFAPGIRATEGYEEWLARQQQFYVDLFAKGKLVWSSTPSPASNAYVNPELRVYRIDHLKPPPDPNRPPTAAERYLKLMEERRKRQQQQQP